MGSSVITISKKRDQSKRFPTLDDYRHTLFIATNTYFSSVRDNELIQFTTQFSFPGLSTWRSDAHPGKARKNSYEGPQDYHSSPVPSLWWLSRFALWTGTSRSNQFTSGSKGSTSDCFLRRNDRSKRQPRNPELRTLSCRPLTICSSV